MQTPVLSMLLFVVAAAVGAAGQFLYKSGADRTTDSIASYLFNPRLLGLLLAGTDWPVIPCYLEGAFRAWPKGSIFPRPRKVRLVIGPPRHYSHLKRGKEAAQSICQDLRDAVLALRNQIDV